MHSPWILDFFFCPPPPPSQTQFAIGRFMVAAFSLLSPTGPSINKGRLLGQKAIVMLTWCQGGTFATKQREAIEAICRTKEIWLFGNKSTGTPLPLCKRKGNLAQQQPKLGSLSASDCVGSSPWRGSHFSAWSIYSPCPKGHHKWGSLLPEGGWGHF